MLFMQNIINVFSYSDASIVVLNKISTQAIFFYCTCTGDEAHLTDCVITGVNNNICGNKRVGLMCEIGNIHKYNKRVFIPTHNSIHR